MLHKAKKGVKEDIGSPCIIRVSNATLYTILSLSRTVEDRNHAFCVWYNNRNI